MPTIDMNYNELKSLSKQIDAEYSSDGFQNVVTISNAASTIISNYNDNVVATAGILSTLFSLKSSEAQDLADEMYEHIIEARRMLADDRYDLARISYSATTKTKNGTKYWYLNKFEIYAIHSTTSHGWITY